MSGSVSDCRCTNCKRLGTDIVLEYHDRREVRRKHAKLYFAVASTSAVVGLCEDCGRYLMYSSKNNAADYWPAMIYVFLTHQRVSSAEGVSFEARWNLLPASWKRWWRDEFVDRIPRYEEEALFKDVTEELAGVEEAIADLVWMDLALCMDKHFAYPEVRCPFGCSEFLHRSTKLPLEDFLWRFSNYQMPSYCSPVGRDWTDSISPSYPSSWYILDKFRCAPSVAVTEEGAMILGCREHSKRSKEALLHMPESPSGTIYSPFANGFAPVAIRSRTNRNFKGNVFSDTFCTVKQMGGYSGIDTSYVTTGTTSNRCDALSSIRDALSIQGRPDIKAQVFDRSFDKSCATYMPKAAIDSIIQFSEKSFPDASRLPETATSTFVSCEEAVRLQERTNAEGSKTIKFYKDECGTEEPVLRLFTPPWPMHDVKVHPTDGYGQRFYRTVERDAGMWLMLSMTTQVPELWAQIAMSVEDNLSWHGHWLRYATSVLHLKTGSQSSRMFPIRKKAKILGMFAVPLNEVFCDGNHLKELFGGCDGVHVIADRSEGLRHWQGEDVVICLSPWHTRSVFSESFELRCLLSAGAGIPTSSWQAFVRHSGQKFWAQQGAMRFFSRCHDGAIGDAAWKAANVAVYCKRSDTDSVNLTRRYMRAIGGQDHTFCGVHRCLLVLNPQKKNAENISKCVFVEDMVLDECCGEFAAYICPLHKRCKMGICSRHLSQAKAVCVKKTPETVLSLSPVRSEYVDYRVRDDGAVRGNTNVALSVAPEALGPITAHEIPQDLLSCGSSTDGESDDTASRESADGWTGQNVDIDDVVAEELQEHDMSVGQFEDPWTGQSSGSGDVVLEELEQRAVLDAASVSEKDENAGLLCTDTGNRNPAIHVENRDGTDVHFPLSVILNQQGHLLARNHGKLRMNKGPRAFFEKIVSRSETSVVPLVYAEAQLFPSIFWHSLDDGTIPGAMPTALWTDAASLKKLGIAGLRAHAKNRITNPALLSSVDPSYHFLLMDELVNLGLRGHDSRLVLHRGFADEQGSDGVRFRAKSDAAELYGEASENHANVHKLSALVRDRRPHYFFTQSCNQSTCCGLRKLRDWVMSQEAVALLKGKYGLEYCQARRYLRESAASYILRSWNEVSDMWMNYIINSPDQPLGEIEYAWYRKEFQGDVGNPSHIHSILRTTWDADDPDGLKMLLSKIRGCVKDLISRKEYAEFKNKGVISSVDHLVDIMELAKTYLSHRCHARCQIPKRDYDGNQSFACKVKDNYGRTFMPFQHTIEKMTVHHTSAAKAIYNTLGMMSGDDIIEPCLKSEMHSPISCRFDRKFSPTNGQLFSCYPSAQNLQFCSGKAISAYLVKYVAGLDDVAIAVVHPARPMDKNAAKAVVEPLHNTKITSNKVRAEELKRKTRMFGRILTQMEALTVALGDPLVTSTETFVHIPTAPREYRSAFKKRVVAYRDQIPDEVANGATPNQDTRRMKRFPIARLFSDDQLRVIKDELESNLTTDKVTVFSLRPPELRFIDSIHLYFKWFEREPILKRGMKWAEILLVYNMRLDSELGSCEWIDGLSNKITLRRGALDAIVQYAEDDCPNILFGAKHRRPKDAMLSLLKQIRKLCSQFEFAIEQPRRRRTNNTSEGQYKKICRLFLTGSKSRKLPTPWITAVYPKNRTRFLVHVLLHFGRFETEYGLMSKGSMRDAYIHAGLYDCDTPIKSLNNLMARYVRECLAFQAGSVYQHDRSLVLARAVFRELLLSDVESDEQMTQTPCVLQTSMIEETNGKIEEYRRDLLQAFIGTLFSDLLNSGFAEDTLPDKSALMNLEPCESYTFPPLFKVGGQQGLNSYEEQRAVLKDAQETIHKYKTGRPHKNLVVCGGPGNGKTTVCEEMCLYAFSEGLTGIATSIVADRSKALGGIHIHLLCSIQARDGSNASPGAMAEVAIASMYRKPELYSFWKRLDFLYIDELGAVSAEMLAIVDIVARHIKGSSQFMGGMIVIGTMDILQLLPFNGTPLLLSMTMMIEFTFVELNRSVRAANDENLRRICDLSRTMDWTDELKSEFRGLVKDNCNFVASFDDERIPEDGVFVFGRRAPCKRIEDLIVKKISRRSDVKKMICVAIDEESSKTSNWKPASNPAIKELSRRLKRPYELHLFQKGRYEFTYNLNGQFQQGQLAILLHLNEEDVRNRRKLEFFKGPPGCKEFPPVEKYTPEYLQGHGWKRVFVPYEKSKPKRIWSYLLGRRTQYGVRLRVASTIHASMGSTLRTLVTAVCDVPSFSDLDFTLWDAAQIVVLISRTRRCSDMYFVGAPDDVVDQLLLALTKTSKYMTHIRALQAKLCDRSENIPVLASPPIFRPCDFVLHKTPAVYLLVSTRFPGYMYIGETVDIRKRLNDHNSGGGTGFTNNSRLRPWAVFGYLYGISSRRQRRLFEQTWKRCTFKHSNRTRSLDPPGVIGIARNLVRIKNRTRTEDSKICIQLCGHMEMSDGTCTIVDTT